MECWWNGTDGGKDMERWWNGADGGKDMERWWNGTDGGKSKYLDRSCPSAFLSTTNLTLPVPGPIPGLRSQRPRNEGLSYKNQVLTSKRTHSTSITNTSKLILFWEMIALYRENRRTCQTGRYTTYTGVI